MPRVQPKGASPSASEATKASRANLAKFAPPPVKGKHPGRIPTSTPYVAPVDDDEQAAFAAVPGRDTVTIRGKRIPRGDLTAAQQRMRGVREPDPEPDDDGEFGPQDDHEFEDEPTFVAPKLPPVLAAPPVATPADPQGSVRIGRFLAGPVSVEDVDRLWDWVRLDGDRGASFLGRTFARSTDLHQFMIAIVSGEHQGLSLVRSLYWATVHIGFGMLAPILAEERTALMHVYLQPEARNNLAEFMPLLVQMAEQLAPNVHLAVASDGPQWERLHARVLEPLGFVKRAMFIR